MPRAGVPQTFGTITVSDGISMGTEGMKYSLVSREVIADSIETVAKAASVDGVIALAACDKNMPGAMIGMARLDVPAIFVYGGTIEPGHLDGRDLTIVSVFETLARHAAGKATQEELDAVERNACPGAGGCGGMFTANTMSSAIEAMGMSLPGSSTMSAISEEKAASAARSAEVLLEAVRAQRRPSQIMTRPAFENAIAVVMAVGGSTNAVLHLLAMAHASRVPLTIDDFERGPRTHARPVRPLALGPLRDQGPPPRGGHPAGHEDPARERPPPRRLPHRHAGRRWPRPSRTCPQSPGPIRT